MGIRETLTKEGKISYRVQIRKKGYSYIGRTFESKEEAEKFEKTVRESMNFSDLDPEKRIPKLPLKIWIDRYIKEVIPNKKNGKSEINFLNFWNEYLGNKIAVNISSFEIETIADSLYQRITRHGSAISSETRRKYIVFLSVVYSTAIRDWKWALYNPVTNIKWEIIKPIQRTSKKSVKTTEYTREKIKIFNQIAFFKMAEKDMNLIDLAKLTGIPKSTVREIFMEGSNPSFNNILIIADFLGIELNLGTKKNELSIKADSATPR